MYHNKKQKVGAVQHSGRFESKGTLKVPSHHVRSPRQISIGEEEEWNVGLHAAHFCEKTSLHGMQYLGEARRHICERVFWICAITVAIFGAGMLISQLYRKWDQNPVIVSFSTSATGITDIPFPAFTICNMNNLRRTVADKIMKNNPYTKKGATDRVLLEDLCSVDATPPPTPPPPPSTDDTLMSSTAATVATTPASRIQPKWAEIKEFMVRATQPCHELLVACAWQSSNRNCTNLFNTALTDEGLCCSFNKVPRELLFRNPRDLSDLNITFPFPAVDWTPEEGYPSNIEHESLPWKPVGAGKHLGLTIVVDCEIGEYFCSSTASIGFKMLLHSPVETPKLGFFGFAVRPGTENFITIKPKVTSTTRRVSKVALRKRHCYFAFERDLRFYRTYTQHNCMQECEANYTLSMCRCVLYHMPKDQDTRICGKKDEKCANEARALMEVALMEDSSQTSSSNTTETHSCRCLPGCSEVSYEAKTTSSTLSDAFNVTQRFTPLTGKDINITYFKENYAIIHLFFAESEVITYQMDEIFGFADFVGSVGGLLGLFLGFSILSMVEVAYFISLRLVCSWRRDRSDVSPPSSAISTQPHLVFMH